jgi:hypothetical protein
VKRSDNKFPTVEEVAKGIEILSNEKSPSFDADAPIETYRQDILSRLQRHFKIGYIYSNAPQKNISLESSRIRPLDSIKNKNYIKEYSY